MNTTYYYWNTTPCSLEDKKHAYFSFAELFLFTCLLFATTKCSSPPAHDFQGEEEEMEKLKKRKKVNERSFQQVNIEKTHSTQELPTHVQQQI